MYHTQRTHKCIQFLWPT